MLKANHPFPANSFSSTYPSAHKPYERWLWESVEVRCIGRQVTVNLRATRKLVTSMRRRSGCCWEAGFVNAGSLRVRVRCHSCISTDTRRHLSVALTDKQRWISLQYSDVTSWTAGLVCCKLVLPLFKYVLFEFY